jgi:hypothetical protein
MNVHSRIRKETQDTKSGMRLLRQSITITRAAVLLWMALGASACAAAGVTGAPQAGTTAGRESTSVPTSESGVPTGVGGSEASPASPTPDVRLLPENWQDWPVVPAVSDRAREIYEAGIARGNNPSHFSKVGDCQNITEAFMGIYDLPDRYSLPQGEEALQSTIDAFAGSFGREGMAVKGGFNVASVLSPMWADPDVCQVGETPLQCELRLQRPVFVFISMEVWFEGRTPQVYEDYLRQIVEYTISQGAVPVLATKADNVEGDHSINRATAQVAYEYDLPLWNFWLAVQPLTDHGIDWARDSDGFHLTVESWNVRSYTALQVLDALRSALQLSASAG